MLHNSNVPIQGKRVSLRGLQLSDALFIQRLLNTEGWLRYIGNRNISDESSAQNYLLQGPLQAYEKFGYGLYCVEHIQTKVPIGMCGLLNRDTLENPDLGFAFLPEFMRKGYAEEACKLVLEKQHLPENISTVDAITLPENSASIALLKKLDFVFVKAFTMPNENEVLHLYRRM